MLENGSNWMYEKRISNLDGFTNESTGLRKNPIIRNWINEMLENGANWIYERISANSRRISANFREQSEVLLNDIKQHSP